MSEFPETRTRSRAAGFPALEAALCLALLIAVFLTYSRVFGFGFLEYDDGDYVVDNINLRLTPVPELLRWIFLSFDPDNWFPLTRLSLLTDYRLFGLDARWYHGENVLLHGLASVLLFWFLRAAGRWPAALAAAVFALHPLHVESVAWVAERKDVLCALFWFAALLAWKERDRARWYVAALGFAALSLMAKPMAVTLPLTMILADIYPLRRPLTPRTMIQLTPFVVLSGAVALLTLGAQSIYLPTTDVVSTTLRLQNAAVSVAGYLKDTFWPARLWAPYAWPRTFPVWLVASAATGIVVSGLLAGWQARKRPWLTAGICWFLVTLIPVIGLVQAGPQSRADRYMYVPMVGLLIVCAGGAGEIKRYRRAWCGVALGICAALAAQSWRQTAYWSDSQTLLNHAIEMDPANYVALNYQAQILPDYRSAEAERLFRRALSVRPDDPSIHYNLALLLCTANRAAECLAEYEDAIALNPQDPEFRVQYARQLTQAGRAAEAMAQLRAALRAHRDYVPAITELALRLVKTPGQAEEGLRYVAQAEALHPRDADSQTRIGQALLLAGGHNDDAAEHFEQALRLNSRAADAHRGLATIYRAQGLSFEEAAHLRAARAIEGH